MELHLQSPLSLHDKVLLQRKMYYYFYNNYIMIILLSIIHQQDMSDKLFRTTLHAIF